MLQVLTRENNTALLFGTHEIMINIFLPIDNPYFDMAFNVIFKRPDGSTVKAEGFYDGNNSFKARAYCDMTGSWEWESVSDNEELNMKRGTFKVETSLLKGKLRRHVQDPRQFAYDNGQWFLHIGDTAYRYPVSTEPNWKEYIDQAVQSGITKVRVWFSQGRSDVQILFDKDRKQLNLEYWQEIDRRLTYALNKYPEVIFQIIIFGEDSEEVLRYGMGDKSSLLAVRYTLARFSSFSNVCWCISNDLKLEATSQISAERQGQNDVDDISVKASIIKIAQDIKKTDPWGTLLTNHQQRFAGYSFVDEPWSDVITLEDLGQVTGELILKYRAMSDCPVIIEEDRYESWRQPVHNRYFFRRFMWVSLLSGGYATYGGLKSWEAYDGDTKGIYGYYDACREGKLKEGAHDFKFIHKFFTDSKLSLINMLPDDSVAGDNPLLYKVIRTGDERTYIVYAANPDIYTTHCPDKFNGIYSDETANMSDRIPMVALNLPQTAYKINWYDPDKGEWFDGGNVTGGYSELIAPDNGDWVILLIKEEIL